MRSYEKMVMEEPAAASGWKLTVELRDVGAPRVPPGRMGRTITDGRFNHDAPRRWFLLQQCAYHVPCNARQWCKSSMVVNKPDLSWPLTSQKTTSNRALLCLSRYRRL